MQSQTDSMYFCICRTFPNPVPQEPSYLNSSDPVQLQPIYENGEPSQMTWVWQAGRWTKMMSAHQNWYCCAPVSLHINESSVFMVLIGSGYGVSWMTGRSNYVLMCSFFSFSECCKRGWGLFFGVPNPAGTGTSSRWDTGYVRVCMCVCVCVCVCEFFSDFCLSQNQEYGSMAVLLRAAASALCATVSITVPTWSLTFALEAALSRALC
jgi:hypothetical protein